MNLSSHPQRIHWNSTIPVKPVLYMDAPPRHTELPMQQFSASFSLFGSH